MTMNDARPNRGARGRWTALALLMACGMLALTVAVWTNWDRSKVDVSAVSAANAEGEFENVIRSFNGKAPLLSIPAAGSLVVERRPEEIPAGTPPASKLLGLGWDPSAKRLYRSSISLRSASLEKSVWSFLGRSDAQQPAHAGFSMLGVRFQMNARALQESGRVLLFDHRTPAGQRVLAWSE